MFNVARNPITPQSLATQQNYDGADVYNSLCEMFFNKCYICESPDPHDINIEHFHAHQRDINKKFEWNNLYLACSRCNNIKGTQEILDCCDAGVDVFRAIKHLPPATPRAKTVQIIATQDDAKTLNTCMLLNKVYNSDHTVNKKVSGVFLRTRVYEQYNLLLDQINIYYSPIAIADEKETAIERIKILITRSAPYSAFIRWCVLEDEILCPMLEHLMD